MITPRDYPELFRQLHDPSKQLFGSGEFLPELI
jgi:hypothetical protein